MTVEVAIVISILSFVFNLYTGISNLKRGNRQETKEDTSQIATMIVKLDNISDDLSEIKIEVKSIKADVKEDHDRIIRLEESAKQAHKRLDGIDSKNKKGVNI